MEYLVAVILFGLLGTYGVRILSQIVGRFIPAQLAQSPFFPIVLLGGTIVIGMWIMRKVGAGKIVREATGA